jgi:hypothetical protein
MLAGCRVLVCVRVYGSLGVCMSVSVGVWGGGPLCVGVGVLALA